MADQPQITADIRVGDLPGGNNTPPTAGRVSHVKSIANLEYVAGRTYDWYVSMPRGLPWAIDDISHDFGNDIYDRMLLDPQCRSVFDVYKAAVLETGLNLSPALTDKDADGYEQSKDLLARAERMLDQMDNSIEDVLWNMLDAGALGYKIAEQVYDLDSTSSGKPQYVLRALDVKPRESVAFVIDPYMHVLGMLARIPGEALTANQSVIVWDPSMQPNFLPRSKFAVLTFRPNNNDPRGTSMLRPAWAPWNAKQMLQREWMKYLTQFASPSLIGFTAEGAMPYAQLDPETGEPMTDAMGEAKLVQPEQKMVDALENFANGTATAFPYGALVQVVEMQGEGAAFVTAYQHHDRQIAKAILGQTLATEEGQHQSRASSGTHKDILDMLVLQGKRPVARMMRRDVFPTWLMLNGEQKLIPLLPKVALGAVEREDQTKMIGAVAALFASGYLHNSQLADLDETLSMPRRNPPDAAGIRTQEVVQVKEDGSTVDVEGNSPPKDKPGAKPKPAAKVPKVRSDPTGQDFAPQSGGG